MSATGLDVFDKTLQTTNIWLDEIMAELGPDRQLAWHVLGAVIRALRDRLPIGLAANLGSQLPILVRGAYYDQWTPRDRPLELRSREDCLAYAEARNIPVAASREKIHSRDRNIWYISHEGGVLEDTWTEHEEDMWRWTKSPEAAPDAPTEGPPLAADPAAPT